MKHSLPRSNKAVNAKLQKIADQLERSLGEPVVHSWSGGSVSSSIADVKLQILESEVRALRAFLNCSKSIQNGLLETASNADPAMAVARHPPPIRPQSKSLDAICCALELQRRHRLPDRKAAIKWVAAKSDRLVDRKIAGIVLGLAGPSYQRRAKHLKARQDFKLETLDGHPEWAKYRKLASEGFSSMPFAAILLAAEYELGNSETRNTYMSNGLEFFLSSLGFDERQVKGYTALIRDQGAKSARIEWGYLYKDIL